MIFLLQYASIIAPSASAHLKFLGCHLFFKSISPDKSHEQANKQTETTKRTDRQADRQKHKHASQI
jgi:hypothetical protein